MQFFHQRSPKRNKLFQVLVLNWSLNYMNKYIYIYELYGSKDFLMCNILHLTSTCQGSQNHKTKGLFIQISEANRSLQNPEGFESFPLFYEGVSINPRWVFLGKISAVSLDPSKQYILLPNHWIQRFQNCWSGTSSCRSSRLGWGSSTSTSARWK